MTISLLEIIVEDLLDNDFFRFVKLLDKNLSILSSYSMKFHPVT